MTYTDKKNLDCPNCNKSGLAILPVRYAVVPKSLEATLPAPLGNKVTDVKLEYHKYALRTLRAGFCYLFYENHARGSHIKWEVYAVTESGTLWKQPSADAITPKLKDPACSSNGHNIPASVISIESPEKCKRVWIAFSEHVWSADTLKAFTQDVALRDRRMQSFLPATWISAGGYRHGLAATCENVEKIVEYKSSFNPNSLNGDAKVATISNESGAHNAKNLIIQTSRYPAVERNRQSGLVVPVMKKIGENKKGKDHPPIILALWDAVGITHELNGFRNDAAGWVEKYNSEREQQVNALMAVEGLKQALVKNAGEKVDEEQNRIMDTGSEYPDISKRRTRAASLPPDKRLKELEICDILEDWKHRRVPSVLFLNRLISANQRVDPSRANEISQIKLEVESLLSDRSKNAARNIENAKRAAWEKYEDMLVDAPHSKIKLYQVFKENHDRFGASVDDLINKRTLDLVKWLSSAYLLDALVEYHPSNLNDGVAFDELVGSAIFGINSSEAGRAKLDTWIQDINVADGNLLWRSIAFNQAATIGELKAYLNEASRHAKQNTPASADSLFIYAQKSLKAFVETYKKFASVNASNADAVAKTSKAFGVPINSVRTRNADLVIMTAGDKLFKLFGLEKILDRHSEYMIQHLLSIRCLVDPVDSTNLIRSQIKNSPEVRRLMLQRLRAHKTITANGSLPNKTPHTEALEKGWKNFKETSLKAGSASKDARLALLIMLIEGANFFKLMADCVQKNDAKSWWSLAASGMTITSALFDLASVPIKNTLLAKGDAISYQRVKLMGGMLSAGAAAATIVLDHSAFKKEIANGDKGLIGLYTAKMVFGGANIGFVAATTFTYAAPLIEKLTGNAAAAAGARAIGTRATAIIAARVLFMAAGAWITVITFGIQILIWVFSKNELQSWCRLCVFGVAKNETAAYKSTADQNAGLEKVLIGMGIIEDKAPKDFPKVYPTVEELMNHD
jgi:hypothetical protein